MNITIWLAWRCFYAINQVSLFIARAAQKTQQTGRRDESPRGCMDAKLYRQAQSHR